MKMMNVKHVNTQPQECASPIEVTCDAKAIDDLPGMHFGLLYFYEATAKTSLEVRSISGLVQKATGEINGGPLRLSITNAVQSSINK